MGKSLRAPFFISFLLVATAFNLLSEVNGLTVANSCPGPKLYVYAGCDVCEELCGRIQGIICVDCFKDDAGESYCSCAFPHVEP
ncbi:hypothetical protein MKW94_002148 [Papaver nudicaule]|uniref:Uncharacterized protein n=1 Tax=Papaver nudicaule TaxID=74823 RepID=A0AA41S9Z7_PAPNU|nr:hypothetical protein [Papaver nudicaule]